jgi:hypothetical protein
MYAGRYVKCPKLLSDFKGTDRRKNLKFEISRKFIQWERSCSMLTERRTDAQTDIRTDRQTDMKKLTVAFRDFANASKNSFISSVFCAPFMLHIEATRTDRCSCGCLHCFIARLLVRISALSSPFCFKCCLLCHPSQILAECLDFVIIASFQISPHFSPTN